MTLITNSSIFKPIPKVIKFQGGDIVVTSGANVMASLPLCSFKVGYEQFSRLNIVVPSGATDFQINFQQLGLKTTFVAITTTYCGVNPDLQYLKWKFLPSSDPKWSMTSGMILTATSTNPIPTIVIDNPNPDCDVVLNILSSSTTNDFLTDTNAFLYLSGLTYDKVHTYNETTSQILAFFDSTNVLVGTVNISDIVNVTKIPGQNRIVIDEASNNDIVLDFVTANDAMQAFSAINWVMADPSNRLLPQPQDVTPPAITKSGRVNTFTNTMVIDLSLFSNNYTTQDFITDAITSVIDNRDGLIILSPSNIVFSLSSTTYVSITNPGIYTATITISDIAGNVTTTTVLVDAQPVIIDAIPPVIVHTGAVTGLVINTQDLAVLSGNQFTYNDAKVLAISSVTDNLDGLIPLSLVGVLFFDNNMVPVSSPIVQEGHYTVRFTVQDAHSNVTSEDLTIHLDDTSVDSSPEIYWTNNVNHISLTATISLSINYGSGAGIFTKADSLSWFITQILDDIDGVIIPTVGMITFLDITPASIPDITLPGTYACIVTVTDTGSNTTMKTINITVTP